MKRILLIYIILLHYVFCNAQMHNVWMLNGGGLNFNTSPTHSLPPPMYNSNEYRYASICDSSGKLKLYTDGKFVYNANNEVIDKNFELESGVSREGDHILSILLLPLPGSRTEYYLFHVLSSYKFGGILYYSIINTEGYNGNEEIVVKNKELFKERFSWVTAVKHENKRDFWIVMNAATDTFYSIPLTSAGFGNKIQSSALNLKSSIRGVAISLRASFDGKTLVNTFVGGKNKSSSGTIIEHYSSANSYAFDNSSGMVSQKKILIENHLFNVKTLDTALRSFNDATFSPNDSLIYVCNGSGYKSTNLFQVERFAADPRKTVTVIPYPNALGTIQTGPDGYTYIPTNVNHFNIIKYPDRKGMACTLVYEYLKSKARVYMFPSIFMEIRRIGFTFNACNSAFGLSNFTDTAFFKEYTWFFPNGDSLPGKKVCYTFGNKSGKYLIKLRGRSKYGATFWSSDTVHYTAKPTAKFTHKDTLGCQWVGLQFTNQSFADTFKYINSETYLWDFGDGTTDTAKNPLHIYTRSGNFRVSLIYGNGFCTDTFVQEQEVEILAAPKPGFTVNDTTGCAPFTVNIKDQSAGEVQKYMYAFGKEFQSADANPSYTFTKPGIYWVSQKLLGKTGCITSDSVNIRIREGILPGEKPEMLRATFNENNQIEISWKKHHLAKYYTIYKQQGNSVYKAIQKHFSDTAYMENVASIYKTTSYYITATDSCGNISAPSLAAQPVLLKAENINNQYILLQATTYKEWQNGVQEYVLEIKDNSNNFITVSNNFKEKYEDSLRIYTSPLQQCYRIKAVEAGGNKQISYSNSVCVSHLPQLYIPNAFSPNNDELNDHFVIYSTGIRSYKIDIYNRWGELVFSGDESSNFWDGKFKSTFCPVGEYLYTIHARSSTGDHISRTGNVMLVR